MPRFTMVLLAAALLYPAYAPAQTPTPPRKQTRAVARGMTPAQVRQLLGEPVRVRREGELSYMEYPNGCAGCTSDYVVVRDCRVVGAHFENPGRQMLATPAADTSTPPEGECRLSLADTGPPPLLPPPAPPAPLAPAPLAVAAVADTVWRGPGCPADTGRAGRLIVPADGRATLAERPLPDGSGRAWRRRLVLRRPADRLVAVPAASLTSPTAFGVQMGEGFAGFAYQARTRYTHLDDGAAAIGVGFGDRERYAALEVAAISFSTIRGGGPLETGGLSFKLHRSFGDRLGVAVGWENAVSWGGSDAGNSPFAVATRIFRLRDDPQAPFSAVAATVGVGGGRFRREADVVNGRSTANVFGALGVRVAEPLSLAADWNGQDLYAGVSVTPLRHVPLLVNAGFADITGSAGDGARFIVSAAVGFRWLPNHL
jgi:hypothetical protein